MKKRLLPIFAVLLLLIALLTTVGCDKKEVPIERIAVTSLPRLEYLKGQTFDLNNAKLTVYYADGTSKTIPLTYEMISEYNPQRLGEHILLVRYENASTNIKIRISNAPIVKVETVEGIAPFKDEYIESQQLDITNLKLKIYYETGDPDIIDVTEDMVSGYDPDLIGRQELVIRYLDKYIATREVTVKPKSVINIQLQPEPSKKLYLVNEKIDAQGLEGGVLFIAYNNGYTEYKDLNELFPTQEDIDNALVYDTSIDVNREIVRLNYGGKYVNFDIKVLVKQAVAFELISKPTQLQIMGTDLSLRGGQLEITYNNETTEIVNMTDEKVIASGYDKNTIGKQTITLSFTDVKEKFSFEIDVYDTKPMALEILLPVMENGQIVSYSQAAEEDAPPASFYQEGTIDLDLWEYRFKMDNGTYSNIYKVNPNMLVGDQGQLEIGDFFGVKTLTFKYSAEETELVAAVEINVQKKELVSIVVTPPTNTIYYRGQGLVPEGAYFTAYFNDGTSFTQPVTMSMLSGYIPTQLGTQTVNVIYRTEKYGEKMDTFKVLVVKKATSIAFESLAKTVYVVGEEFDIQGLVMRVYYEGDTSWELEIAPFGEQWVFKDTLFEQLGQQYVTVEYQAYGLMLTATIPVTVKNDPVSLRLTRFDGQDYQDIDALPETVAGMDINLDNLYVICGLENGEQEIVKLTSNMLDYRRSDKTEGERTVTVLYRGLEIETTVTIVPKEISDLRLIDAPEKRYYKAMEEASLDVQGLEMRLAYSNETYIILNGNNLIAQTDDSLTYRFVDEEGLVQEIILSVTPLDTTLEDEAERADKTIYIGVEQFEVSFEIVVAYKIATGITWNIADEGEQETPQPEITALQGINNINFPEDAKFKVIYNEGQFSEIVRVEDVIDEIEIYDYDYTRSGVMTIYLRYQDIYLSAILKARAKDLKSIDFAPDFLAPDVTEGMPLDLRQAKIIVTYYHDMGTPDESDDILLPPVTISLAAGMTDYNKNDLTQGARTVAVTYKYTGNREEIRNLYFNVNVVKKRLVKIEIGIMPKTKYIELDTYNYDNGTVIVYYNNNSTVTKYMSQAQRVRNDNQATENFYINYGQFNSEDFSGFAKKQEIFITYKEDDQICVTSYDIIMHDRLYAQVRFARSNDFDEQTNSYYFWYGEDRVIDYQILGYPEHTDIPDDENLIDLQLVPGINYTFKYINEATGEEYGAWPKDAGTYIIYINYDADAPVNNDRVHNSFTHNQRKIVIQPKNIHIRPMSLQKVYGENNPEFVSDILAVEYRDNGNGEIEIVYHIENVFGYNDTADTLGEIIYTCIDSKGEAINKKSPVGNYEISVSCAPHRNYNITFEKAEFTVTKRKVVIIADPQQKEYGQPDPVFTYSTAAVLGDDKSGLIEGDTFLGMLLRVNASVNRNVGVYEILLGSLTNNNYEIEYVSNYLTIYKRKLIIIANSYTKVYGQQMPLLEVTPYSEEYPQPFAYEDSLLSLGVNPQFNFFDSNDNPVSVNQAAAVGVYRIMPGGVDLANYEVEYREGSFEITPRKIRVIARPGSKIYGEDDPSYFEYSLSGVSGEEQSGLFNDDQLIGELTRQLGEDVGQYAILQGSLNDWNNPNYQIFFQSDTFAIEPRPAQVELTKLSREYNGLLPSIEDEYIVIHNAHGDIRDKIELQFIAASKNVGAYKVELINNDSNHILELYQPYNFTITPKVVATQFFNIPYGNLVDGEFTGSVYKGHPYYYEARVLSSDICQGDTVDVIIHTADITENPDVPVYLERKQVTDVGIYSVKAVSLTNNNYRLRIPDDNEIESIGDYRLTTFKIIPAEIKVTVTVPNMEISFNRGYEVKFKENLRLDGGYYRTDDYRLLTKIDFVPDIIVQPYYIDSEGREKSPQVVLYRRNEQGELVIDPETGEYIIDGYNIKAQSRNKNYTVVLTDADGTPIERDENGEIIDAKYRLKIVPALLDITISVAGVSKVYDGLAPEIPEASMVVPAVIKGQVDFEFIRHMEEVPAFMVDYIVPSDTGTFDIVPVSLNLNYRLRLSDTSAKIYTINKKVLNFCNIDPLTKQYDGLKPALRKENFNFGEIVDTSIMNFELEFETDVFDVGSYPFTVKFLFPHQNPEYHSEYSRYLDYNHVFGPTVSLNKVFHITPRSVNLIMMTSDTEEGFNWKYYNGKEGAVINYYDENGQPVSDDQRFLRAFIIEDARDEDYLNETIGGQFENGEPLRRKHLLNQESNVLLKDMIAGTLRLGLQSILHAPRSTDVLTSNITSAGVNPNFHITRVGDNFTFTIRMQTIKYHFSGISRIYGENLPQDAYIFDIEGSEAAKICEEYTTIQELFEVGAIFSRTYFSPYAVDSLERMVDNTTPVGLYDILSNDVQLVNDYILVHDPELSRKKLEITRRPLPVSYIDKENKTVTREYGDELHKVNFTYLSNVGQGSGLMSWDADLPLSPDFVPPQFTLVAGAGDDIYRDCGIIEESAIIVNFSDLGVNPNYYFTYYEFYDDVVNDFVQPKLEITKATLSITVLSEQGQPYLEATYGDPPASSSYYFDCQGFKLNQNQNAAAVRPVTLYLPAETVLIDGQEVTFNASSIELSDLFLSDVLRVKLDLHVNWNSDLQQVQPHEIRPYLAYQGVIRRQAANGSWHDYHLNEEVTLELTNYYIVPQTTQYLVKKRQLDVWLKLLDSGNMGEQATFNILWDETPYLVSKERILLADGFTKDQILLMNHDYMNIIEEALIAQRLDLVELALRYGGKEYFLDYYQIVYEVEEIDDKYAQLTQEQLMAAAVEYPFTPEQYEEIYNNDLTQDDIEYIYSILVTETHINYIYEAQGYTQADLDEIIDIIMDNLDYDDQRLLFEYVYDFGDLAYGDTIGISAFDAINVSGIYLDYDIHRGENKSIKANGVISDNYEINYIASKLNIYRYAVSLGYDNELPNIMLTETDEFMVRVNYVDGSYEYLSFKMPRASDYEKLVDYNCEFEYVQQFSMENLNANQTAGIRFTEQFFGNKSFVIDSKPFQVRVLRKGDDLLLWGKDQPLGDGKTGGSFVSAIDNKSIGEKIDANYTYYVADGPTAENALVYNYDIIKAAFTLFPKTNTDSYYFEIIVNGTVSEGNYLALRFSSGSTQQVTLVAVTDNFPVYHTVAKPGNIDLFDGKRHEIIIYVDKLGTRQSDASGYKLLAIIDNCCYFNFTTLGKGYVPTDSSVAGFEANNCVAYISRFNLYQQGLMSSRALKVLPSQNANYIHSYSVIDGPIEVNLADLIQAFTFHSSSYYGLHSAAQAPFTYDFILNGETVAERVGEGASVSQILHKGLYSLEVIIYCDSELMDSVNMVISVSDKYANEILNDGSQGQTPYMAKPATYYGYLPHEGDESVIGYTSPVQIVAANNKAYTFYKSVFELDWPTYSDGTYPDADFDPINDFMPTDPNNWDYPFSAAFILKTNNSNIDLRKYDPVSSYPTLNGIGLYVRYDGNTFYTRIFIRLAGLIRYTSEFTNINWKGQNRTVLEAAFDEITGTITIYVKNDGDIQIICLRNGYSLQSGGSLDTTTLLPIIQDNSSTSMIMLRNAKIRVYQAETGVRKVLNNNYYNFDTKQLVANTDITSFYMNDRIFIDNGSVAPKADSYDTYTIKFKGRPVDDISYQGDYLKFIVGTNNPTFLHDGHNRGIYIGYNKQVLGGQDTYLLYFAFYKAIGGQIRLYREQFLASSNTSIPGLEYTMEIGNLLDGEEHTLTFSFTRDIHLIEDASVAHNRFLCSPANPMSVYLGRVYLDGELIPQEVYIPVNNDLANWMRNDGQYYGDNASGLDYDSKFLPKYLYPGLELLRADIDVIEWILN